MCVGHHNHKQTQITEIRLSAPTNNWR